MQALRRNIAVVQPPVDDLGRPAWNVSRANDLFESEIVLGKPKDPAEIIVRLRRRCPTSCGSPVKRPTEA